jgi:hypothetical protein
LLSSGYREYVEVLVLAFVMSYNSRDIKVLVLSNKLDFERLLLDVLQIVGKLLGHIYFFEGLDIPSKHRKSICLVDFIENHNLSVVAQKQLHLAFLVVLALEVEADLLFFLKVAFRRCGPHADHVLNHAVVLVRCVVEVQLLVGILHCVFDLSF